MSINPPLLLHNIISYWERDCIVEFNYVYVAVKVIITLREPRLIIGRQIGIEPN